jgi:hypothetical protein
MKTRTFTCQICDATFHKPANVHTAKYCDKCRKKKSQELNNSYRKARRKANGAGSMAICAVCGESFRKYNAMHVTCSDKCKFIRKARYDVAWLRKSMHEVPLLDNNTRTPPRLDCKHYYPDCIDNAIKSRKNDIVCAGCEKYEPKIMIPIEAPYVSSLEGGRWGIEGRVR